jgi:tetratricopeptide (TPR) repeat protein
VARIYVSSTYSDLRAHREKVYRVLRKLRHDVVAMEDYVAADQRPLDRCLDDVAACDLYLGIFAHRYGYVPEHDNPGRHSITEREYRYAEAQGIPRLVFLLDENTPWPPEQKDAETGEGEQGARIRALREELGRDLLTSFFSTPDDLATEVSVAVSRQLAPAKPGPSRTFLPAPTLAVEMRGRDHLLRELSGLGSAPDGKVRVLCGLGGSGKSTVAQAAAAQIKAAGGYVWWVPAADAVSLTQRLLGLARDLDALPGQVEDALAGRVDPSDVLWRQLEAARRWTLVLDNADDPGALAVGGRPASWGSGWLRETQAGLVVVTSRIGDRQVWGPVAQVIRLEPLGDADGAQVLLDLAPGSGDRAAAQRLSERLGGLPLALHHAGSYLTSPFAAEASFAGYERALSVRFGELMGRGEEDRAKVIATWELSLDALEAQGRGQARQLLRVLSCFDSTAPIPPLLRDHGVLAEMCGTTAAAENGMSGLWSVGLIDTVDAGDGGKPEVKVHPLVAETVRYQAGQELLTSLEEAVKLLAAAVGRLDEQVSRHADRWVAVLPHLQALQLSEVRLSPETEASLAQAAASASLAMVRGGRYVAALDVAESGLERGRGLPGTHPMMLRLRYRRAVALKFLVRRADAEAEFWQIFDAQLRVLGPDDPETLSTRHEIAFMLFERSQLAEAETRYRQVLDARLRVLGPDHPDTLSTRHEIAITLAEQGELAEAEDEFRQVLDARLRVLGSDEPDTLLTRQGIAVTLGKQGNPTGAEAEFRQILDAELRVLGPDHPETLNTRANIAAALANRGKLAEAEDEFRQILDARLRVLGPDHPATLSTRRWLDG